MKVNVTLKTRQNSKIKEGRKDPECTKSTYVSVLGTLCSFPVQLLLILWLKNSGRFFTQVVID